MLELLALFVLTGVCAPYDWNDCNTTLVFIDGDTPFGYWEINKITFIGDIWNYNDCWGMNIWQHEWMHKRYGQFHMAGHSCLMR